ncbi:MAG: biotin--[acetyl-CoA-carboxylase] ligase [Cellulomonadaceae bacterium]|nr:biotin--[acetyl-CoA-carboxylase] ligase [Cellulomonadaceae bacterium]
MTPALPALDPETVAAALEAAVGALGGGATLGRVVVVASTASTSSDLVDGLRAGQDWPDRSVLVADHQTAGRGRAGRTWTTPAGVAVTASLLSRPGVPVERLGWVPLIGGLAVVEAIAQVSGLAPVLKWPNDVLVPAPDEPEVDGWGPFRKVAGVLGDLIPAPDPVVVLGIGINVSQDADELPVDSASSLALAGASRVDRTELLAALVARWVELDTLWREADGDAWAAGIGERCAAACVTLGRAVRVELPGGDVLDGMARGLEIDGSLRVEGGGRVQSVHAGDVRHVRVSS